jgi:hypothetical protein
VSLCAKALSAAYRLLAIDDPLRDNPRRVATWEWETRALGLEHFAEFVRVEISRLENNPLRSFHTARAYYNAAILTRAQLGIHLRLLPSTKATAELSHGHGKKRVRELPWAAVVPSPEEKPQNRSRSAEQANESSPFDILADFGPIYACFGDKDELEDQPPSKAAKTDASENPDDAVAQNLSFERLIEQEEENNRQAAVASSSKAAASKAKPAKPPPPLNDASKNPQPGPSRSPSKPPAPRPTPSTSRVPTTRPGPTDCSTPRLPPPPTLLDPPGEFQAIPAEGTNRSASQPVAVAAAARLPSCAYADKRNLGRSTAAGLAPPPYRPDYQWPASQPQASFAHGPANHWHSYQHYQSSPYFQHQGQWHDQSYYGYSQPSTSHGFPHQSAPHHAYGRPTWQPQPTPLGPSQDDEQLRQILESSSSPSP